MRLCMKRRPSIYNTAGAQWILAIVTEAFSLSEWRNSRDINGNEQIKWYKLVGMLVADMQGVWGAQDGSFVLIERVDRLLEMCH